MKNEKPVEISVKTVFTGKQSQEQAFLDLIRRRSGLISADNLAFIPNQVYTEPVVLPDVREAPERGICYE